MTIEEAIDKVSNGERVTNEFSLFTEVKNECEPYDHHYKTLFCNGYTDVLECSKCGKQIVDDCDFSKYG